MARACALSFVLLLALFSCKKSPPPSTSAAMEEATGAPAQTPEAPAPKKMTYDEAHAKVFEDGTVPECQGLDAQEVLDLHEKRVAGSLVGSVITAEEQTLINCDHKITLLAEGRKAFQGL